MSAFIPGTPCPDGKYAPVKDGKSCTDKSTSHCAAHAACAEKQWTAKAGTPRADTVCKDCKTCGDGYFAVKACAAKADTLCRVCKKCAANQLTASECTADKDTVCISKQKTCKKLRDAGLTKDGMYELTIGWAYCILNKDIGGGGWNMVLNVHPNDGHSAAWAAKLKGFKPGQNNYVESNVPTFWAGDLQYAPNAAAKVNTPFGADYSSKVNKKVAATEMMIVRHKNQKGKEVMVNEGDSHFMWKRWKFVDAFAGKTFLYIYRNTFRTALTGKHVQENLYGNDVGKCPIFGYSGVIYTNFYYSNNGARLILDGQSLSAQQQNDDSSFGLGMEFASHQGNKRFSGSSGSWCFDASYKETSGGAGAQGNDSCNSLARNDHYLGEYAIFVR